MHTIVIASQKGGVGKSSLAAHLAVEAERAGAGPVVVVDTDPQATLADWWNARVAETPAFAAVDVRQLRQQLENLEAHDVAVVIIDTAPGVGDAVRLAVSHADLVIVPCRASPNDLRAIGLTLDIIKQAGKPFVFVINAAVPRSTIAADTLRALAQHGKVAPVTIHNRIDFAASMVDGRTAQELNPSSRSADEIAQLWIYVNTQLSKIIRTS
jgi:chromosome partitioning protein